MSYFQAPVAVVAINLICLPTRNAVAIFGLFLLAVELVGQEVFAGHHE